MKKQKGKETDLTTFIIPTIGRPTLQRAIDSTYPHLYIVQHDKLCNGPGITRNEAIKQAITSWVSMLDDDDTVTHDYVDKLREELESHPNADVIIFREFFPHGVLLPAWPVVTFANIPISFSLKRSVALEFPFLPEPHEDYELIKRLKEAGKEIVFSQHLTYKMRH